MRVEIADTNTLDTKVVWKSEKDTLSKSVKKALTDVN